MNDANKILRRVRKLIDKANSTEHEAEREAFMAKAQKMMTEHAISAAELEMAGDVEKREPVSITFRVMRRRSPGLDGFDTATVQIAKALRCNTIWAYPTEEQRQEDPEFRKFKWMKIMGMPEDAMFFELLITSLMLQVEQAYERDKHKKPEWTHGRTYRANYFSGFWDRVGDRIERQAYDERVELEQETSGTDLVLADVKERVDTYCKTQGFNGYVTKSSSRTTYDATARADGGRAGDSADLSGGRTKGIKSRGRLTA